MLPVKLKLNQQKSAAGRVVTLIKVLMLIFEVLRTSRIHSAMQMQCRI